MNSQNKRYIIVAVVGLIIVLLVGGIVYKNRGSHMGVTAILDSGAVEAVSSTPVEIVLDFYNPWLDAVKSTTTNPYKLGLPVKRILSKELRTRLASTEGHVATDIDPVLCQTTTPKGVNGRIVSQQENEARVLVVSKDKTLTAQSVFTLKKMTGGWYIDSILCSPGEFEIPREFSFDQEGFLLRRVPPPLDSNFWHIVFEENGEKGHAVALFFDASSECTALDGAKTKCNPDLFTDAMKVHVYAQMTEAGAQVKRLEFVK